MKQVLVKGGKVDIVDVPPPGLAPGMALVRVSHSLISSGTESSFVSEGGMLSYVLKKARDPLNVEKVKRKLASVGIKGTLDVVRNKLFEFQAPGYSTAGVIVECAEDVPGFRVGDRVACAGVGYASHAEYNAVPHQLLTPIPDGVDFDEAAFVALGVIAMQGVRRAQLTLGETVVVLGLGLLGQLAAQIVRASGCRVIGCDPIAEKRALAQQLGADVVCAPGELTDTVGEWTGGYGADAVIICAASKESGVTNQALDLCRQKGRVTVVGAVGLELQREPLYMKELDFFLSCSYGPGRYNPNYEEKGLDYPIGYVRWTEGRNMAEFLRLIAERKVQVKPLISVVKPVNEAQTAYSAILEGRPDIISALIHYGDVSGTPSAPKRIFTLKTKGAASGEAGIAVIGAGAIAQAFHFPSIAKIPGCRLEAVADRVGSAAKQAGDKYGARYCTTEYRDVLQDANVNAVVIATRHNLHKEIALAAIEAGKHVFVEKPLALTVEDCETICAAVEQKGVVLTVGFNRRFSPWSQQAKQSLKHMPGTKMILYRCNAGPLPKGHWATDPIEGGGRIVGEAVHFFDWCCWMLDADPVSVRADRVDAVSDAIIAEDNLTTLLRFPDGSLATIVYCCVGHPSLAKERIEVFGGNSALTIDDYKGIELAGVPGKSVRGAQQDKGMFGLMENFIQAIRGEAALSVTAQHGLRATRIAREALNNARAGAAL
ncbi:MAG TPA: bi-domain-containing oxidoreductase [Candidatus Hydrogenedentes bacterium]|nr:bi-domain-containing oxidoreductase [Candidatus Hydrogenedentota bacterium]